MDIVNKIVDFTGGSSKGFSIKSNSSDLINLYPRIEAPGSKSPFILVNSPGYLQINEDFPTAVVGIYEFKGVVYVTTNTALYTFTGSEFTEIGTIDLYTEVSFANNGIEMVMVGGKGYSYNPDTDTLTDMTSDPSWYQSTSVAYMDGYFIFARDGTGEFFISKLFSTEIDPIDWATGEAAPDDTEAIAVVNRQLWLLGEASTEVWYDSGDAAFPFTRVSGAVTDIGILNHTTMGQVHGVLYFVGQDYKVYRTKGYGLEPISTPAIELAMARRNALCFNGFTYVEDGHAFYVLSICTVFTFVYDMNTNVWHRRSSCTHLDDEECGNRWAIDGAISFSKDSKTYGYLDKKLVELSTGIYTENGLPIARTIVTLPLNNTMNRIILSEIRLDMEVGYVHKEGEKRVVCMQASKNNGLSWGFRNMAGTGRVGEYTSVVKWRRLGQFIDVILKFTIVDPVRVRILGLWGR